MNIVIRRALMRELGAWATQPVGKSAGVMFGCAAIIGVLWLTNLLVDAGSFVKLFERLKDFLDGRRSDVIISGVWPFSLPLLLLNGKDIFTLGQALLNVLILGGIGTGKTSGPFQYLIRSFIRHDFGGLFLCVKVDSAVHYQKWAREEGREKNVIVFGIGSGHSFNFLQHILSRCSDGILVIDEIAHILMETLDVLSRHKTREERFFREAAKGLFAGISTILYFATGQIELSALGEMLSTLPRDPNQAQSKEGFYSQMLERAWRAVKGTAYESNLLPVIRFFQVDWASYAPETRESMRATAQVLINELTHYPLRELFGQGTTVTPEDVLNGKLLIIDIPIHRQRRVGQIAATIWKTSVQRATLARYEENRKRNVNER